MMGWIISFMVQSMGYWVSSYDVFMDMFAAGPPKAHEPGDRSIYIERNILRLWIFIKCCFPCKPSFLMESEGFEHPRVFYEHQMTWGNIWNRHKKH